MKKSTALRNVGMATALVTTLIGGMASTLFVPGTAWAQVSPAPNVTLDLQDAPLRSALEQIFRNAKVDFSIDPSVQGYVNLKVTDLPFDSALKLILRSSTTPLTYTMEGGVYLIKPRATYVAPIPPPATVSGEQTETHSSVEYDRIELIYADPVDLAQILNITMIPIGTRYGLNVPGASGIARSGNSGNNGSAKAGNGPGTGNRGTNGPGNSGPGPGGNTIIGL